MRYLGLIGSRAKVARIYEALEAEGITPEQLRKVHAPVGLDLGAVTPQEIAVSILAEMIGGEIRQGRRERGIDQCRVNRVAALDPGGRPPRQRSTGNKSPASRGCEKRSASEV